MYIASYRPSADDPEVGYFAPEDDTRSDAQRDADSLEEMFRTIEDAKEDPFEMDAWDGALFELTISEAKQAIDFTSWLAGAYSENGALRIADECRRAVQSMTARLSAVQQ